jgi:hypothetical protein
VKGGSIAVGQLGDKYSFDGYKDRDISKKQDPKFSFAYEASMLALHFLVPNITPIIYATPDIRNRAVIMFDKKLGFNPTGQIVTNKYGTFLIMEKKSCQ